MTALLDLGQPMAVFIAPPLADAATSSPQRKSLAGASVTP